MAEHYTLSSGVTLSATIKPKVKKVADAYHTATSESITVTSGTRSAASQADAMYGKLVGGDKLSVYRDQVSAKEIKKSYDDGKVEKKSKSEIFSDMTTVIKGQIAKKKYISKHLRAGAVDIRSKDMSATEKEAFRKAAKGVATKVILESTPPHWHLQF